MRQGKGKKKTGRKKERIDKRTLVSSRLYTPLPPLKRKRKNRTSLSSCAFRKNRSISFLAPSVYRLYFWQHRRYIRIVTQCLTRPDPDATQQHRQHNTAAAAGAFTPSREMVRVFRFLYPTFFFLFVDFTSLL